jgi:hypothetical protein
MTNIFYNSVKLQTEETMVKKLCKEILTTTQYASMNAQNTVDML